MHSVNLLARNMGAICNNVNVACFPDSSPHLLRKSFVLALASLAPLVGEQFFHKRCYNKYVGK
ncbi:hypothetical protein D6792_03235 [Candidatus Parcubacteria bacterium]|nr:MAG: hypothetical protein D6792_03235 [Candidatus Parcubacteria bacterium]